MVVLWGSSRPGCQCGPKGCALVVVWCFIFFSGKSPSESFGSVAKTNTRRLVGVTLSPAAGIARWKGRRRRPPCGVSKTSRAPLQQVGDASLASVLLWCLAVHVSSLYLVRLWCFSTSPPQDRLSMHYARLLHCLWDLSHACMSHFVRMCCCMPRVLLRCVPGMSLVLLWDFCHIPLVFLSDSSNWILDLGPSLSLDLGLRPSLHLDRPRPRPRPSTSRSPGMAPRPSPQLPGLQPPDDQLPRSPCYRS